MLKLKNVSKFYYSKGVIASGFSKVNLELNMGEFVVITGESGSGKSTLLNVLSGLDTYEEGEMYINGQETSHYNEADFEEYRRKYVGNIFQNFNLINSYTVYQNVELALLLNGEKKEEVKDKVNDIIEKVGLSSFSKTKCSKLSGGQKQRVAIARALAKETPIIVADEPTGNLDTESAAEIIKLLSEIAKDKLVIIVTHNLEQVEHHATRLIKMHDGKILEDKVINKPALEEKDFSREYKDITLGNRIRIGCRNAFNIPAKFILIFAVFFLIASAIAATYSSFQLTEYNESVYGWNEFFNDTSDSRIVINKPDRSAMTEDDFAKLESLENVKSLIKDDTFVDYTQSMTDKDMWYFFYGNFADLSQFDGELTYGRMPQAEDEILLYKNRDDYDVQFNSEDILNKEFFLEFYDDNGELQTERPLKIVGIATHNNSNNWQSVFYVGDELLKYIGEKAAESRSTIEVSLEEKELFTIYASSYTGFIPNDNVPKGEAYVSTEYNDYTESGYCIGKTLHIQCSDMYRTDSMDVTITATYNKWNFESLIGESYDENREATIYVNSEDYYNLINGGLFQSTVYVKDVQLLDDTVKEIQDLGFNTLVMRDALSKDGAEIIQLISMMKTFTIVALIVALFFISYFIIKIVLKSRNAYYTTIRTLGGSRKISKQMLDIELFVIATLAYCLFMVIIAMVNVGVISSEILTSMIKYLNPGNYVMIYVIAIGLAYLISTRFARNLFKNSVMNTYREEV